MLPEIEISSTHKSTDSEMWANYGKAMGGFGDLMEIVISFIAIPEAGAITSSTNFAIKGATMAFADDAARVLTRGATNLVDDAAKGVLNPNEIYFMQNSIKNTTGEFTVLGNAEALANGSLNPNVLRMNVWKDASGKVWTLDHRRLGAFRLSGLQEAPIQWANPSGQMWKMTTTNGGASIKLKLGGGNSMIIK